MNKVDNGWFRRSWPGPIKYEAKGIHALRYVRDIHPPETNITLSVGEVSQPGNTPLAWIGADPWGDTQDEELQYAWRLDWEVSILAKDQRHPSLTSRR